MTSIDFHVNIPSKLDYCCRLLRKAMQSGSTIAVVGEEAMMSRLDVQLWTFSRHDFLAHGWANRMSESQRMATPIWLCNSPKQGQGRRVLVNLGPHALTDFDSFERLIELVGED